MPGRFQSVTEPTRPPDCFERRDDAAVASQAAQLLLMSAQLSADPRITAETPYRAVRESAIDQEVAVDLDVLGVPRLAPTAQRVSPATVDRDLRRYVGRPAGRLTRGGDDVVRAGIAELARHCTRAPDFGGSMALARSCLEHPEALVRVAAAVMWFRHSTDPARSLRVLSAALDDETLLVRDLAATALAGFSPTHRALRRLTRPAAASTPGRGSHTATIVHGTWASGNAWWQPGGDFHTYLSNEVRDDMYAASDRFDWSGGYSDAARSAGATALRKWISDHELSDLDLVTHSHGGSVAMEASQAGTRIGHLVLLSCPAHEAKYLPDFANVRRASHVRVRLDLVVLVDGGGFKFREPRIEDVRLPIWFDHSASHQPEVWREHGVAARIGW